MAAISQVWWPSCPHEWAFPFLEAHSHPDFSSIGRASISALRAPLLRAYCLRSKGIRFRERFLYLSRNSELFKNGFDAGKRASCVETDFGIFVDGFAEGDSNEIRIVEAPDECFLDLLCFSFSAEIALLNKASFSEGRGR